MLISANENDRLIQEMGYDLLGEYKKAVLLAGFDPNRRVLDVATGSGRMATTLSVAGYTVLSGDIDPTALEKARVRLQESNLTGVELIELDATRIPFADEFASVMCANAIHHIADPVSAISEMAKACAKDGKLALMEFSDEGFVVMESVHRHQHKTIHGRGCLDSQSIEAQLKTRFADVVRHELGLNNVWIASGKS